MNLFSIKQQFEYRISCLTQTSSCSLFKKGSHFINAFISSFHSTCNKKRTYSVARFASFSEQVIFTANIFCGKFHVKSFMKIFASPTVQ